jgi:hypothetical protein
MGTTYNYYQELRKKMAQAVIHRAPDFRWDGASTFLISAKYGRLLESVHKKIALGFSKCPSEQKMSK